MKYSSSYDEEVFFAQNNTRGVMAGKRKSNGSSSKDKNAKSARLSADQLREQPWIPDIVGWFLGPIRMFGVCVKHFPTT